MGVELETATGAQRTGDEQENYDSLV